MSKQKTNNVKPELAKHLEAIIDTAIDGIITISVGGIVEVFNPAAAELFGYEPEEVIGNNIKMLMEPVVRSEHDYYLDRYKKTRKAHIIGIGREVKGLRKDGTVFPFRLAVSEVVLNDRVIYTGVVHDISEIKKAQDSILTLNAQLKNTITERTIELENTVNKLLSINKRLEGEIKERERVQNELMTIQLDLQDALSKEKELNELKSRFVSMASHEFRTPLTSILSSAAIIGRYDETSQQPQREKHVDRIKSSVANLTGILNDFLSLTKIEEGKVHTKTSEFKLAELCDLVLNEIKPMLKGGQKVNAQCDKEVVCCTDKHILKNIIFNLVSNAIKYSEKDIDLHLLIEGEQLHITVIDRGIGIPEEDQKYLFGRFFRAGNVTNIQGTGLGLNIVQRYVDILGGELNFESKLEEGTTFNVTIPNQLST